MPRNCHPSRQMAVTDLVRETRVRERVSVIWSEAERPVQFELSENRRDTKVADVVTSVPIRTAETLTARRVIDRCKVRFGITPDKLIGDKGYSSAELSGCRGKYVHRPTHPGLR